MSIIYFTDFQDKEHAIIEHEDGSMTTMLKSEYERQQAEQSTPIVPGDN
jgi:hypothetical protein